MGFYLRKSVRVGPFRLNLSKSGVGVSAGIPGFRIGRGPRGSYIRAGLGGLHYHSSLNSPSQPTPVPVPAPAPPAPSSSPDNAIGPMREIDSGSVLAMKDASAEQLLGDLNARHRRPRYWRWVALGWLVGTIVLPGTQFPVWFLQLVLVGGIFAIPITALMDWRAKHTALLYELDSELESRFRLLCERFDDMAHCSKAWHVNAAAAVRDKKYHAGASAVIKRDRISLRYQSPPYIKTNLSIPAIPLGRETLYFFPERVLVFSPSGVGAVSYGALNMEIQDTNFIESDSVPRDSKIVGRTFQYVNKQGGPDRRFKNNRELPILLYETVRFKSESGLNEELQLSRSGSGDGLRDATGALHAFWSLTSPTPS